jgi:outer membrane protein insertion porin family
VNPRFGEFPEETGVIQIARLGASYIRDRRDDPINPSTGSFDTTTLQVASRALGSEVNFTSFFNQSSFYWPFRPAVLAVSARLGWIRPFGRTERPPITERFFAGGSTTLRGYDQDEAGVGPEGGGNVLTIVNVEYRFPIRKFPIRNVGGAFFYDTGNVFRKVSEMKIGDFTHTAGLGLRYQTPVGPVRLDFAVNLRPKIRPDGQREERSQWFFTLGHTF